MGLKAPRGYGWLTNPKKAAYNRIYSRTSRGCLVSLVVIGILWTSIFLAIASAFAGGKTVHVNGYIRKDGTYVHSYNRAAPGTASVHSTAGRSYVPSTASTSNSSSVVPRVVTPAQSAAPALTQQQQDEAYAQALGFRSAEQYRKWKETGRVDIPAGVINSGTAEKPAVSSTKTTPSLNNGSPYTQPKLSSSLGDQRETHGKIKRSEAAKHEFMQTTGYPHGRPGYVVDHIVPLKRGGCDCPSNMQWQTIQEAKAKDKWE